MTILTYAAVIAFLTYVFTDMAMHAPGEKRRIDQERRLRVHTKSHHYKITRK
jgi:hypothetical protein